MKIDDPDLTPKLSVVLLSFNRPELLSQALASVVTQSYQPHEVIVVDNRSPRSEKIRQIVSEFPNVIFVSNPINTGFTGGMNLGIKMATGDYIHLSEDDILLEKSYLQQMISGLKMYPNVGLVSGIQQCSRERWILFAGGSLELGGVLKIDMPRQQQSMSDLPHDPYETDFLIGSMMTGQRSLWQQLVGFEPSYFMYLEDVELSIRVKKLGLSCLILPDAVAEHLDTPKDGNQRPNRLLQYHRMKNLFHLMLRHGPAVSLPVFLLRYGPWSLIKALPKDLGVLVPTIKAWGVTLLRLPTIAWQRLRD
jgi:N-acetylglucosaminyl-diphospho-decaprenol L-rhamnosyltransferase